MGDQWCSFEPKPLKNKTLPPGYLIDGITDEEGHFYYWYKEDLTDFGDHHPSRTAAYNDAWNDFKAGAE